jgi:hypothetical protein
VLGRNCVELLGHGDVMRPWSWDDGDFAYRRKRNGKWPAVPERGRLTVLAAR